MKKLFLLVLILFFPIKGMAQLAVVDASSAAQLISLVSSAGEQIVSLSKIFGALEEANKIRKKVTDVIVVMGDVKRIITYGSNSINTAKTLIEYISKDQKIISPKSALRYSDMCIKSIETVMRNLNKLSKLLDSDIDGDPVQKVEMIANIEKDMEKENEKISEIQEEINSAAKMRELEKVMFKSQGL